MTVVAPAEGSAEGEASGETVADRVGRVIAPVSVNGQGPYRFIIDTGANRSALSHDLAAELGLVANGSGQVHTIDEVAAAPLVDVSSIEYAGVTLGSVQAPLINARVLSGEDGLLGVDGMRGRRLTLDFQNNCLEISEVARSRRLNGNWTAVRGELRFGHLVLIEGRVRDRRLNVLIDTGSSTTLANTAARELLRGVAASDQSAIELIRAYTAGSPVLLESRLIIPELTLGQVDVVNVTAYIGDFHIFDLWGLRDEPTLLIGMDVLSKANAIAIDYARANVYFRIPRGLVTGSLLRGVSNGPVTTYNTIEPPAPPPAR